MSMWDINMILNVGTIQKGTIREVSFALDSSYPIPIHPCFISYFHPPSESNQSLCFSLWVMSDSFLTPWTVACLAPLSMGFPRQKYCSGLPSPSLGDLPTQGWAWCLLYRQVDSSPLSHWGSLINLISFLFILCYLRKSIYIYMYIYKSCLLHSKICFLYFI